MKSPFMTRVEVNSCIALWSQVGFFFYFIGEQIEEEITDVGVR